MKITLNSPKDTEEAGRRLGERVLLRPSWGRAIFLYGEMGMGKTTFLKGFAQGLKIKDPVSSPTFALVAEYEIPWNPAELGLFCHLDIFRVDGDSVLALPEINEKLDDPGTVVALEWADKFPAEALPERRIEIRFYFGRDSLSREVEVEFIDPGVPDDHTIRAILDECQTPIHIRKHIGTVTRVSSFFSQRLVEKGYFVDQKLVRSASLLHDAMRLCNFKRLDKDQFTEEITPEKWAKWESHITQFGNRGHAEVVSGFLRKYHFDSTADVIEKHSTKMILTISTMALEEKCLYLADRYAMKDKITPLEERLRESNVRNRGDDGTDFDTLKANIFDLEKEICDMAGLLPEEILVLA